MTNLDRVLKIKDITVPTKVHLVKAMVFPVVMYGWMWDLDYIEGWVPKNWCFWIVVLEKTLGSSLHSKEFKPVSPKGNQPWIFIGRTDVEVETLILWPSDTKSWCIGQDPDAGRLRAGGKEGNRGWYGWTASPTQWTWILANSGAQWRTGKPGVLQSMGSQRVGHGLATEWQWWDQSSQS